MYRVYLVESIPAIRIGFCKDMSDYCQIMVCTRAENALEEMAEFRPDILVLDMSMPGVDGFELVDHAYMLGIRPKVLASSLLNSGALEERLLRYGAGVALIRPFTVSYLTRVTMDILLQLQDHGELSVRHISNEMLLRLGVYVHLQGYRYVLEALCYAAEHLDCTMIGELYPYVAKKFGVSISVAEKNIHRCIEKARILHGDRVWSLYFPKDHNGKIRRLSNSMFLKRLALAVVECMGYKEGNQKAE